MALTTKVYFKVIYTKAEGHYFGMNKPTLEELKNDVKEKIKEFKNDKSMSSENKEYWIGIYETFKFVKVIEITEEVD